MPARKKDNRAAKRPAKRAESTPPRSPSPPASRSATPSMLPALPPSPAVSLSPSIVSLRSTTPALPTVSSPSERASDIVEEYKEDVKDEEDEAASPENTLSKDTDVLDGAESSASDSCQTSLELTEAANEEPTAGAAPSTTCEDPAAATRPDAVDSSEIHPGAEDAERNEKDLTSVVDPSTDAPPAEVIVEHGLEKPAEGTAAKGSESPEQPEYPMSDASASRVTANEPGAHIEGAAISANESEDQKPPTPAPQTANLLQTPSLSTPAPRPQSPDQYPRSAPVQPFAPLPTSSYLPQHFYQPSSTPLPHATVQSNGFPYGIMSGMSSSPGYSIQPQHAPPSHSAPYRSFSSPFSLYGSTPQMQPHASVDVRAISAGEFGISQRINENSTAFPGDAGDLLSRISSAIPDLHLLLSCYNEARAQLGVREELLRKAEAQHADLMKRKEEYIDALTKQLDHAMKQHESTTKAHEAESNRLRLQLDRSEEKTKELEDRVNKAETSRKGLQEDICALESQKMSLEGEKADAEAGFVEEGKRMLEDFEDWKTRAKEDFDAEKLNLTAELEKKQKEQEDTFEMRLSQANGEHAKEKDTLSEGFAKQRNDLEAKFNERIDSLCGDIDRQKEEFEAKLDTIQHELEDATKREKESREAWMKEKGDLTRAWDEERTRATRDMEEQRQFLTAEKEQEKNDVQRFWLELQADLTNKREAEKEGLTKEIATLREGWDKDRETFDRVVSELRSVTENLGVEKGRLQKMVDCFGEVMDLKSKGDAYYLDAFTQLSRQILDLSTTHFQHLPASPPSECVARIPPNVPSFLDDTPPSRHLRSAYIAHIVSHFLTSRVFTPFLFSLGQRYDKADGLFTAMSNQLRGKSTRKEAIWRQHTLVAAFTTTDAKERINAAAGAVVEEIVDELKHWADPGEEEAVRVAVRRIVKLAAETWRLARLEREMITARMPSIDEQTEEDKMEGLWPAQTFDTSTYPISLLKSTDEGAYTPPKLLLRLMPVIQREAIHPDFQLTEQDKEDKGCIYYPGLALYDNAMSLRTHKEELARPDSAAPTESPQPTSASEDTTPAAGPPPSSIPPPASAPPDIPFEDPVFKRDQPTTPSLPPSPRPASPLYPITDEIDAQANRSIRGPPLSRRSTFTASLSSDTRSTSNSTPALDRRASGGTGIPRSAAIKGLYRRPGSWGAEGLAIQRRASGLAEGGSRKGTETGGSVRSKESWESWGTSGNTVGGDRE
ncbi:hypothetical protein H2201_000558 [Coniosporium apollinis]|uniref:Uncharacterized protein n=1 Tax=Coniosporium apollinis TaxID=61459 RepID=A0ABQ9P499_9PEZI|nr:hypothetical protein H2201_000558 [Coniosporium apollinis]